MAPPCTGLEKLHASQHVRRVAYLKRTHLELNVFSNETRIMNGFSLPCHPDAAAHKKRRLANVSWLRSRSRALVPPLAIISSALPKNKSPDTREEGRECVK